MPIGYDIYFPELWAGLYRHEPDIIFFPSLQLSDHGMASEALLKARAMDTKAYVCRSSYGRAEELPWKAGQMFGQSAIIHPDGTVLASPGHYEGFGVARIAAPFAWQRQRCSGRGREPVRSFLQEDSRPDVYAKL